MNDQQAEALLKLLSEIKNNQLLQIERQLESLSMQKEQFSIVKTQFDRAEKLNDKAEQIQEKAAQLVGSSRKIIKFLLPLLIGIVGYLTWLTFFNH